MRAYGISVGILAAILVFSLWNSSYMTASGRPSPVRGLDRGRGYAGRQL